MIAEELIEKLQKLPPDAVVKLEIYSKVYDGNFLVDLDSIILSGTFTKQSWETTEKLEQNIYLKGFHK